VSGFRHFIIDAVARELSAFPTAAVAWAPLEGLYYLRNGYYDLGGGISQRSRFVNTRD